MLLFGSMAAVRFLLRRMREEEREREKEEVRGGYEREGERWG